MIAKFEVQSLAETLFEVRPPEPQTHTFHMCVITPGAWRGDRFNGLFNNTGGCTVSPGTRIETVAVTHARAPPHTREIRTHQKI